MPTVANPDIVPIPCRTCDIKPTVQVDDDILYMDCPGSCHSKDQFSIYRGKSIRDDSYALIEVWNNINAF